MYHLDTPRHLLNCIFIKTTHMRKLSFYILTQFIELREDLPIISCLSITEDEDVVEEGLIFADTRACNF